MVDTHLLHPSNILIVAFVWIVIGMLRRGLPDAMERPIVVRLLPLMPIALCSILVWLPGVADHVNDGASKAMLGVVLGAMAANGHKIFRQTALGDDRRIHKSSAGL